MCKMMLSRLTGQATRTRFGGFSKDQIQKLLAGSDLPLGAALRMQRC
jgi:hypothetical protein